MSILAVVLAGSSGSPTFGQAPPLSAVAATAITTSSATITWTTDEPTDSQVELGPTTAYGRLTPLNTSLVTAHAQPLRGLAPGTLYHYRVRSRDGSGNLAISPGFTFTTLAAAPTPSANGTIPGAVRADATIHSIGIEWDIAGDPDHDARVLVQYRAHGASTWKSAWPLIRVDYNRFNGFAGSILFLAPGTTYEVMLDLFDPSGGAAHQTLTVATRPVPSLPTGGRTLHVVPGAGGGDGSSADPFRGISVAQAEARPADIFLLHAGHYGRATFSKAGASGGRFIVWKAAGDGETTFGHIEVSGSYVWLEGLTVRNQEYGLFSEARPTGVVISRCNFLDNTNAIWLRGGGRNWYIADNTIRGTNAPELGSLSGEGIELNSTSGHVVAHNRITRVGDGISYPVTNVDIYGNDIFDVSDDGIEADQGRANVRIWGNRIHMAFHSGISFQGQDGAPWYIIRNQLVNFSAHVFKFRTVDRFLLLHNTIVNWGDMSPCCDSWNAHLLKAISKNNLWISVTGGKLVPLAGAAKDWRTDLDYDGFDWGSYTTPFVYQGAGYGDVASLAAASGLQKHGRRVDKRVCLETFHVPGPPPAPVPAQVFSLKAGCNAIDAGAVLPNINDGFAGRAPDLGAHEYGLPVAQYGPRPIDAAPTPRRAPR